MFEALGITVIDADAISHELTSPNGDAIAPIAQALGPQAIGQDGALDRARVRELAFANPKIRELLESILHPMIAERARKALSAAPGPYAVYAVPLWVEKYGPGRASPGISPQSVVVLDCEDETRITRIASRSGLSRQQILAIMAAQAPRQERLAAADMVLDNNESLESLAKQVARLHQSLITP